MLWDYSNQRVLITGGTSGIGFAIAQSFADAGADVIATGLTDHEVSEAVARDARILFRPLDVRDSAAVSQLVGEFDSLNVLVNCAGMLQRRGAEFVEANFLEVLDINLSGTMRLCLACRPLLAKSRGCIVNTASMLSFFGSGFVPAYSASKGGVAQLTKSLAIAWAAEGIRVNAVAPGWIATPMTQPLVENTERSQPIMDRTPMHRWGRPEEIAGPVLFLCSSSAAFMTGVVMPVDGGYSIA
ncbi:MAG: SDR family NAD(P)-dependent oxidoreductase [Planctomycetaceae bacterium]